MGRRKSVKQVEIAVSAIAHNGTAIGRTDEGMVVFVEDAVPGDRAIVQLLRKRKGSWSGRVVELLAESPHRVEPLCKHFGVCGGCSWQHLNYPEQIRQKENIVYDAIRRIAKIEDVLYLPIKSAERISYYRNKLEFTFSAYRWLTKEELSDPEQESFYPSLGFHRPGNFSKIVNVEHCHLQNSVSNEIRNFVRQFTVERNFEFYDIKKQQGFLRNLIIRSNQKGEFMVIIVFGKNLTDQIKELCLALTDSFTPIKSLYIVINEKRNDSLFDQKFIRVYGDEYLTESLGHVKFLISPKSFFQTNTRQAEVLYNIVAEFAQLSGRETVLDLYCGVGSIGIFLAANAAKVIGVETIAEAIDDAQLNASENQLQNCHFIVSDAKEVALSSLTEQFGNIDVVIVDPPRAGLHEEVCKHLLELEPQRIVYVSCNPSTQARDLSLLTQKYQLVKVQAVDLFPHTNHVESVALLSLRK